MYISFFGRQNLSAHADIIVWKSFWIRHWPLYQISIPSVKARFNYLSQVFFSKVVLKICRKHPCQSAIWTTPSLRHAWNYCIFRLVKSAKNLGATTSLQKHLGHHGWLSRKVFQVISSKSQKYLFAEMVTVNLQQIFVKGLFKISSGSFKILQISGILKLAPETWNLEHAHLAPDTCAPDTWNLTPAHLAPAFRTCTKWPSYRGGRLNRLDCNALS